MKKYSILIVAVALLSYGASYGQQAGERITNTSLSIFNNSEKDVQIKLGLTVPELQSYKIKSQEKWISPPFPLKSKPLFIIKTDQSEKKYTLKLSKTYMIFWNNKKKYWDLKAIKA